LPHAPLSATRDQPASPPLRPPVARISGSISADSVVADGTYIYTTGYQSTLSGKGTIRIEKRNISNLNLAWSYTETDRGTFQSNVHPLISGANLIVVGNNDYTVGLGVWRDIEVLFLSTSKGAVSKNVTYTRRRHR
jgi:hypothetical protein